MPTIWIIVIGVCTFTLTACLAARALGTRVGIALAGVITAALGGIWWTAAHLFPGHSAPDDWSTVASATSESCAKCHADHHASWRRTFHRTMTREATPEYVKGDFGNHVYEHQGIRTRLQRDAQGRFIMETVEPDWAMHRARVGHERAGRPQYGKFTVDRLVGSHWIQECMHRDANGRYQRLPVLYHLGEQRWLHSNGAFLAPDTDDYWAVCRGQAWNETCLYCHNTAPVKNPVRGPRGETVSYKTEVSELGIACEACHGPAEAHVQANHNPARRYALREHGQGDPTIVNPLRLTIPRRDEICAHCHGATIPRPAAWDLRTHRDPYVAGQDIARWYEFFGSEAERDWLNAGRPAEKTPVTNINDGRFWADGTPLTTALEYNGMALSACYQKGHGTMSCLTCHQLHGDDPNFLLKPGMKTNEACLQCHDDMRSRLSEHTRHSPSSAGSQCQNCHMPHVVYSLMTTHRSHRIDIPRVDAATRAGKPNACTLCHLDKSLGWAQRELARWPSGGGTPLALDADERTIAHSILLLGTADARSRAMVMGAFSSPDAQAASGTDWFGPFLSRLLDRERYPAVRYLAHRAMKGVYPETASGFDPFAVASERRAQIDALRTRFDQTPTPTARQFLPLTPAGRVDDAVLRRLLNRRNDPDVTINE